MTDEVFLHTLGHRIREARKARGWTLERLAAQTGLQRANISRIECGKTNMTVWTLVSICEALDTEPARLLPIEHIARRYP